MPPCTHARARSRSGSVSRSARASPPGGGLLTHLTCTTTPGTAPPGGTAARVQQPGPLPDPVTTELVHALAAVAVALAGT